jgi:hypothetical protein
VARASGLNDHRFVQEQGNPFASFRMITLRATSKFKSAIEPFYQPGAAKSRHDFTIPPFEFRKQMS